MRATRRYFVLAAVALLAAAPAARSAPKAGPGFASLAGQLLIATPEMDDPRFERTVILLVEHDRNGAFGIVINRPVGAMPVAELLTAAGQDATGASGTIRVCQGGPVRRNAAFVLHSADYRGTGTIDIDGRVAMTVDTTILRDIGRGKGPKKSVIAFGYAGWGPGQLEGEIARRGWFTAPEDPALIFDDPPGRIWHDALARRTRNI
jgi:putative transcriptional regulator